MATRATQLRILQTALELFNEHGTAAVSSTRVAERSGISKGNLQYHFPNKRDIIDALFQQAIQEMDSGWYRDHLAPTLEHMAAFAHLAGAVPPHLFDLYYDATLGNDDVRGFMARENPAALAAIETCFTRLHEASLWQTRRNSIAAALREAS